VSDGELAEPVTVNVAGENVPEKFSVVTVNSSSVTVRVDFVASLRMSPRSTSFRTTLRPSAKVTSNVPVPKRIS